MANLKTCMTIQNLSKEDSAEINSLIKAEGSNTAGIEKYLAGLESERVALKSDIASKMGLDENVKEPLLQERKIGSIKRGSIQFSDGRTIINLFEAADLSTFLHESGHFFLQVMKDLAEVETEVEIGAPTQILNQWQAVKKEFGIGDDNEISTESNEKFARSFEGYLLEGKAPSVEVAGFMARFRSWLNFVYKSIDQLNVKINPNIRNIFDRMLATDAEIASAQTGSNFRPAFKSAEDAGMTENQWKSYTETAEKAVDSARNILDVKMMQEVSRVAKQEWREAKAKITEDVTKQYKGLPVYQAMTYLRTGKGTMNAKDIEDTLGDGALNKMPKSVPPLYRRKGGAHPDSIAELFGFESGYKMLEIMISAGPMKAGIKQEVDVRMKNQFGDLMGDAVARSREADKAINNDETGDLLQAEMQVLVRKAGIATQINKEQSKNLAREAIRGKTVRQAIRQSMYLRANEKSAKEAEKSILKGDWVTAVDAKRKQLLNHYMAMASREAERDTEKHVRYINKFSGRKRPKNIDPEYLDQIEALLERFDFRKNISLKDSQRRNSLSNWITEQEANGVSVQIDEVLRNDAFRKPYKDMTVDEIGAVTDAAKNIENIGKLKNKLTSAKKVREFESTRNELVVGISSHAEKIKDPKTRNPTILDKMASLAKSLDSSLLKIEQIFDWMDGGDINGPMRRHVWQYIADAEVAENDMKLEYTAGFIKIFGKLNQKRLSQRITIDGVDQTFLRSDIMSVALNMGNESNLDKMLRGENWDQSTLDTITGHLDKAEWAAVKEIWDLTNTLWPEIVAVEKRLGSPEPIKIEARQVETPFGTVTGGYYPVVYDSNRSPEAADQKANNEASENLFERTFTLPATRNGFTKERAQNYTNPLQFDINVIGSHINDVIHRVTHAEAIRNADKLLSDGEVRNEIETRYGKEIYRQLRPWLKSIAQESHNDDGLNAANTLLRGIRSRATIMAMGYRISTIMTQLAGYTSALEMVSIKSMAGAMKDFSRDPDAMWQKVNELSGEMRHRSTTLDRDILEQTNQLLGKSGKLNGSRMFAYYGIGFMDKIVTVPAWTAAYNDHIKDYPGDTEGAIARGDQVIRLTQGSGNKKDLAAVARNNELTKLLTMFYSYFSAYYNRQRTWGRFVKKSIKDGELGENFPQILAAQVFMTAGPAIVSELLVGRGPSEDDEEGYAEWAAKKVALYPLLAVPIVRDAVGVFDRGFGYDFTPAGQTIDSVLVQPFNLIGNILEGEADPRQSINTAIQAIGYALKLPLGQPASTFNNVFKAIEDDDLRLRDFVLSRNR